MTANLLEKDLAESPEDCAVDVLPVAEPAGIDPVEVDQQSALGLVELLLKSPAGVDNLINGFPQLQPRLIPRSSQSPW